MVYNNLYPPVMDAIMPAFVIVENKGGVPGTEPYRIYFSLSRYNSREMIQHAWLSLTDSKTNKSMLKSKTEVSRQNIYEDTSVEGDNRFYIKVWATGENAILKNGWEINKIYKAQIRFSSVGDDPENPEPVIGNNMADIVEAQNNNRFSEWSTVALLQPILRPEVVLRGFSTKEVIMASLGNIVSGKIKFQDGGELESYRIQVYKTGDSTLEYDSETIFSDSFAANEIYHEIKYGFIEGIRYTMKFTYTTKSAYTETKNYKFIVLSATGEPLDAKLELTPNSTMGRVEIHVFSKNEKFLGNLTIRRASSKTNFTVWEDVQHIALKEDLLINTTWYDYGVESGVWYKYCVQKRNARGDRGLAVMCKEPAMVLLEDIFLSDANKHLRIKFNPQISSYTHTLSESSTQTIGAKYPFIKRNANTHYRQFSISGLISHFMDEGNLFTNKEELYKDNLSLYQKYNEDNRITDYNDFILEQKFREKIEEFLYDGQVKLFRSAPEGTMLVRLMNVSLNPEPTLGRMLYSFSATAYEIADFTVDNLKKYNLQNIGSLEKIVIRDYEKYGQFNLGSGEELLSKLNEKEAGYKGAFNYKREIKYLDKIKIYFESEPAYFNITNMTNIISINANSLPTIMTNVFYGYVIYVNNEPFLITPTVLNNRIGGGEKENFSRVYYGYYELEGEDLQITNFSLKRGNAYINYHAIGQEEEDIATIPKEIFLSQEVGQIADSFTPIDELNEFFKARHNREKGKEYESIYSISELSVEAEPGTVFYLQDTSDIKYSRFIVGETGFLQIKNIDYSIRNLCFLGRHLIEKTDFNRETRNNEFFTNFGKLYNNVTEIKNPEKNCVYRTKNLKGIELPEDINTPKENNSYLVELSQWVQPISSKDSAEFYSVIYYEDQWRLFAYNGEQDVIMPTYAQVDYKCEIEKGEYE